MTTPFRCRWATNVPDIYIRYHDTEWGVPVTDDRLLFEFLILEGFQAGLSWLTVLKKRGHFREAFDNFDAEKIGRYSEGKIAELLGNAGIIRNRQKIHAAVTNAGAFLDIQAEFGSFSQYMWRFVDGRPVINHWKEDSDIPATSAISDLLSRDLYERGFKFVGSTIMYAHMQAVGMVNDHLTRCFRHGELAASTKSESFLQL
ncbi:DNA-3-methyladenine glycosylase I [bacterium]|nr:DNA-3-methyladenine glycosylase I [bacterium]